MNVLVVDIGGNNVKLRASDRQVESKLDSGDDLTPEGMVEDVLRAIEDWAVDVVALGVPARVRFGRLIDEPFNLGPGWVGFNFAAAFQRPVRIMNDANLQALGSYDGGRMLFLGLGTGLGSTLIADRAIQSLDLGQVRYEGGKPLCDILGQTGVKELGQKKWQRAVCDVIPMLQAATMADDVVVGGGNAELLEELPVGVRRGHNRVVLEAGIRLWRDLPDPAEDQDGPWRIL